MHRHVEAERFHVRLSPGAASFSCKDAAPHADTLGENRLQARGACVHFSHAGETPATMTAMLDRRDHSLTSTICGG